MAMEIIGGSGEKYSTYRFLEGDKVWSGVDNLAQLAQLASLKEGEVAQVLATRYGSQNIYTYAGSILIAMNPYTKLPWLYDVPMMKQYKGAQFGERSPHVFAVVDASYRAMMNVFRSQSILVRGESGAGKTHTTKLIMLYLTYVGGCASGAGLKILQKVLASYPLLEAFGNAKTVGNGNSSRFTKVIDVQFDENGRISGGAIRTYLLERSRVVQISDTESNYHCFYQLCASPEDAQKYKLDNPSKFNYLKLSKTNELDQLSNPEEYLKIRKAMNAIDISLEDQMAIFRILAAILHLGNVEFSPGEEDYSSIIEDRGSNSPLQTAADLFMCNADLLLETLCTRSIQTPEGSIVKALDSTAAVVRRDALAKTVYARLFDWLVKRINLSIGQDQDSSRQIRVLDIFGFECFKKNSFEQFFINFANEKLQQHFNEHVLKKEQEEYSREDINCNYVEIADNQDVLDLIEKKPIGIITLLDEVCMLPKSTAATFSTKLFQNFKLHPRLEKAKLSEADFTVSHYARKVTYQTDTFLDKNRDDDALDFCKLLSSSKCVFVAGLFPMLPEESRRSHFSSVATRFKQELEELMDSLNLTNPHFIHCLKPNLLNFTDKSEEVLIHQLKCGGVLEAARISLKGRRKLMREKKNRDAVQIQERLSNIYSTMENIDRRLAQIENNMDDKRTSNSYEEQLSIFQSTLAQIETAISHEKPTAKSFDTSLVFTAMQIATTVGVVFPLILPVYPPTNIIQKLFVAGCYGFLASAAAVFVKLIQIINSFQLSEPSEIRYASNLTVATYIFVGIELFTVLAYVSILGVVVGAIFFF